jgi:hypothetical protein
MRTKPIFGKKEPVESRDRDDPRGCFWLPLMIVVSYFVLSAIVRYTSGSGNKLDQGICYGSLLLLVIFLLVGVIGSAKESAAIEAEKKQWKNFCASAEVAIVSRDGYRGGSYEDEYGIPHYSRPHYRLTLKVPFQVSVRLYKTLTYKSSSQYDVVLDVSESIFKALENRDTVRIYYKPDSPLTFLLEDEL